MDLDALFRRAWDDPEFKARLLSDPRGTLERELDLEIPAEVELLVHEQTPTRIHLILPPPPQ